MSDLVEFITKFGFPTVTAVAQGYLVFFIWEWVVKEVKPLLSSTLVLLVELIDKIRMLDNDLIRLNQKLNTALTMLEGKNKLNIDD